MKFYPIFQWQELFKFRSWNWINFDVVNITFEAGTYKGKYLEGVFVVLGIGFGFEWWDRTSRAVWMAGMDQRMAEAKEHIQILRSDDGDEEEEGGE